MTARTRYFVVSSLLVLVVGLGSGLVAYYVGFPAGAISSAGGPDELKYLPHDVAVVAYADVREVMASGFRQHLLQAAPGQETGRRELEQRIVVIDDEQHLVRGTALRSHGFDGGLRDGPTIQ